MYSPLKAFKEIVKKPDVKGPMLILLITVLLTAGAQYINASKMFFEYATPDRDAWTESISLWTPSGVSIDGENKIVGNSSVTSSVVNGTSVWMKRNVTDIGAFNCLEDTGYKSLSFRIKWIHQNETFPNSKVTLQLFSDKGSYFELDLADLISNSSDKWGNATVNIGSENHGWNPVGSPSWENIKALEFRLCWLASDAANLTMKIDDLYLGKYVPYHATGFFSGGIVSLLMGTTSDFILRWVLYTGLLLLTIKTFGGETGPWRVLFDVIGYVFAITMVYVSVDALLTYLLPPLHFPLKAWVYAFLPSSIHAVPGEEEIAATLIRQIYQTNWHSALAYNLRYYLMFAVHIWTVALGTIAMRFSREFTWKKAVAISVLAYFMAIFLRGLIQSSIGI